MDENNVKSIEELLEARIRAKLEMEGDDYYVLSSDNDKKGNVLIAPTNDLLDRYIELQKIRKDQETAVCKAETDKEVARIKCDSEMIYRDTQQRNNRLTEGLKLGGTLITAGVAIAGTIANTKNLRSIMKFEETGTITSKAFGFISRK